MRYKLSLLTLVIFGLTVGSVEAQERTLRGTVTDSVNAAPVAGVSVAVQGTNLGALTDADGRFSISGVPSGQVTLQVQRIGFRSKQVTVSAGQNQVQIALRTDYLQVDELVVTGRATEVQRRNLATSVTSVSGEEVNEVPQQTVDGALQGRVPGAIISQNSGAPGGGMQFQLRGVTTINAGSDPLYVVDGVIMSNASIPNGINAITESAGGSNASNQDDAVNRIADLNPGDIESIEILKGPSAAAIYGSKAANGVVIIETNQGSAGAPEVRARLQGGFFDLSNTLGARRFPDATAASTAFGAAGADAFSANDGQFFDHEEALAGRNDFSFETSASVSGGDADTRFYGSGLWKNDEGIIANTGFEKQSLRLNLGQNWGDDFSVSINTNVIHSLAGRGLTNNDNSQTSYYMVLQGVPSFIDLRQNEDGTFPTSEPFIGNGSNPLQTAELLTNEEDVWRGLGSVNAEFGVVSNERHDLSLNFNGGVDYFTQENDVTSPPELHFEPDDGLPGTSLLANTDNLNLNAGLNGVWRYAPGGAEFTTSAGVQFERRELNTNRIISRSLLSGQDGVDVGNQINIFENRTQVEDFGFYLQEEMLAMDERLLLTAGARVEQSSVNADNEALFLYPKASISYRFPDLGGFLDEVKLRSAFGQTGNQPVFGQEFTNLTTTQKVAGLPGLVIQGNFTPEDTELEPERQTEIEGGVDITALDGRATLQTTGYVQFIDNLIQVQQLAGSTGFNTRTFNGGELRNWGIESSLGLTPIASDQLTWIARTTFAMNRGEVTDLPIPSFTAAGFGASLGQFQIEEGESPTQIVGTNTSGDLVKLGDSEPDFHVNVSQELRWSDFRLYAQGEWRQGQEVINLTQLLYDGALNSADYIPADGQVDPVSECHPDCSGAERLGLLVDDEGNVVTGEGFIQGTPRGYVQPASFFKLREVSLSYEVPSAAEIFGVFSRMRLTASARGLVRITNYEGLDPEVSNFGSAGVGRSIDVAPFPPSRSFWLGVDVTF